MRIEPLGPFPSRLQRYLYELQFSPLRLRRGTSISLLVQRLRYKIHHLNNHFPYARVGAPATRFTIGSAAPPAAEVVRTDEPSAVCGDAGHTGAIDVLV